MEKELSLRSSSGSGKSTLRDLGWRDPAVGVAVPRPYFRDEDALDGVVYLLRVVADGKARKRRKTSTSLARVSSSLSGVEPIRMESMPHEHSSASDSSRRADLRVCRDSAVALDTTDGDVADCLVELVVQRLHSFHPLTLA